MRRDKSADYHKKGQVKSMKILVVAKQIDLTDDLRELFDKKLKKFDKFFGSDTEAKLTLKERYNADKKLELTINVNGTLFRAEETAPTFQTALDSAMDSIERQIRNIKNEYPEAIIVQESYTGSTMNRPKWNMLNCRLAPTDTIVFDSVSRMARNSEEGFKVYEDLYSKNIDLIFLKEKGINTTTYKKVREQAIPLTGTSIDLILDGVNKYLLALAKEQIKLAFDSAEAELMAIRLRSREGLLTAKLNGKQLGHTKNVPLEHKKHKKCLDIIKKHSKTFGGSLSDVEVMKMAGVCRRTYYRYKRELLGK